MLIREILIIKSDKCISTSCIYFKLSKINFPKGKEYLENGQVRLLKGGRKKV